MSYFGNEFAVREDPLGHTPQLQLDLRDGGIHPKLSFFVDPAGGGGGGREEGGRGEGRRGEGRGRRGEGRGEGEGGGIHTLIRSQ